MQSDRKHSIEFRVQYYETDGQGRVHHGQYINYFERGRVELIRACGRSYKEVEEAGFYLVVSEMNLRYLGAAVFDDFLRLTTAVEDVRGVRIRHSYLVERIDGEGGKVLEAIAEGSSVVACVDPSGKVRRLPQWLKEMSL